MLPPVYLIFFLLGKGSLKWFTQKGCFIRGSEMIYQYRYPEKSSFKRGSGMIHLEKWFHNKSELNFLTFKVLNFVLNSFYKLWNSNWHMMMLFKPKNVSDNFLSKCFWWLFFIYDTGTGIDIKLYIWDLDTLWSRHRSYIQIEAVSRRVENGRNQLSLWSNHDKRCSCSWTEFEKRHQKSNTVDAHEFHASPDLMLILILPGIQYLHPCFRGGKYFFAYASVGFYLRSYDTVPVLKRIPMTST